MFFSIRRSSIQSSLKNPVNHSVKSEFRGTMRSSRVSPARNWPVISSMMRREQLLMPSAELRSRLTGSLEALPQHMSGRFPGTSGHWGLLGALLLPTVFLYTTLFGFVSWVWNNQQELFFQFGGWIPRIGTHIVQWLASVHSGRRPGLIDGLQSQVSPIAVRSEWHSVFLVIGLTLLLFELFAILLLHRLKTYNV